MAFNWNSFRDAAEAFVEKIVLEMEPTVSADLAAAIKLGVTIYNQTQGTPGEKFVEARNATTTVLIADGHSIVGALVTSLLSEAVAVTPAPSNPA